MLAGASRASRGLVQGLGPAIPPVLRRMGAPTSSSAKPESIIAAEPLPPYLAKMHDGIFAGDRRSLSRAITLVESTNPVHREQANDLLVAVLSRMHAASESLTQKRSSTSVGARPHISRDLSQGAMPDVYNMYDGIPLSNLAETILKAQKGKPRSRLRIGISGTPGVGKSTFIEAFGMHLIHKYGLAVAVLSIDPSSQVTGGSILGDKTRMPQLSLEDRAYVRPSPSRGTLGGVAQNTAEAVLLCEAAGYDVVLVETVGVGQSEVTVAQTVDMVVLLMGPGGGDELQGIKKGIMEVADLIVVTKADGALLGPAQRTRSDYERGLSFYHAASLTYGWQPLALLCSVAHETEKHMDTIWGHVLQFEHAMMKPAHEYTRNSRSFGHNALTGWTSEESAKVAGKLNILHAKRAMQRRQWMWSQLNEELLGRMRRFARMEGIIAVVEQNLVENLLTPRVAAKKMLDVFIETQNKKMIEEAKMQVEAQLVAQKK